MVDFDTFVGLYAVVKKANESKVSETSSQEEDDFRLLLEQRTLHVKRCIDATDDKSVESTASSDDETELRVIEQVRAEFETAKRPFETVQATGSKVVVVFKSVSAVDDVLAEYEMLDTYKVNDWITTLSGAYKIRILVERPLLYDILAPADVRRLRGAFESVDKEQNGHITIKDFTKLVKQVLKGENEKQKPPSDIDLKQAFKDADTDGNGIHGYVVYHT